MKRKVSVRATLPPMESMKRKPKYVTTSARKMIRPVMNCFQPL